MARPGTSRINPELWEAGGHPGRNGRIRGRMTTVVVAVTIALGG